MRLNLSILSLSAVLALTACNAAQKKQASNPAAKQGTIVPAKKVKKAKVGAALTKVTLAKKKAKKTAKPQNQDVTKMPPSPQPNPTNQKPPVTPSAVAKAHCSGEPPEEKEGCYSYFMNLPENCAAPATCMTFQACDEKGGESNDAKGYSNTKNCMGSNKICCTVKAAPPPPPSAAAKTFCAGIPTPAGMENCYAQFLKLPISCPSGSDCTTKNNCTKGTASPEQAQSCVGQYLCCRV